TASCTCSVSAPVPAARAAFTWVSLVMSVLRSTRLMSGCAIRRPSASMTKAWPSLPNLIALMTSWMSLRLTSATLTPASRRVPAEVDRTVEHLLGHGLGEFRVLRIVLLARNHVHGEPGDFQLLDAGGIELRQLGDRGHLAQQPQAIEPALVDGAGRPGQLRG